MNRLVGPTKGRPTAERVPIEIDADVRSRLHEFLYLPEMRGVGWSEFIARALDAAAAELESVTVTISDEEIPGLVAYITDGSDLYDEHAVRIHGDGTRPGGLSPVELAVLPALREHFTGDDRVMVDELLAEPPDDDAFSVAMNRFMDKVVKGRDSGWTVKFEGDGEWEVALWLGGNYAGTWRLTASSEALLDPEKVEVCQDCGKVIEPHSSGCCDSCDQARRYDEASR